MLCYVFGVFSYFYISFEYDFHVDAERMIFKNTRNVKKYLRRWFKI